jgi:hypothetical protein
MPLCTHRGAAGHEVARDGDLPGLAFRDALLFPRELHAEDAEVGASEVQPVEQALLVSAFFFVYNGGR